MIEIDFGKLKSENPFSPEERQRIDDFWHTVTTRLSDAHPRDIDHAVTNGDSLQDHISDKTVLKILQAQDDAAFEKALPNFLQDESSLRDHYVPSIKEAWKSVRGIA